MRPENRFTYRVITDLVHATPNNKLEETLSKAVKSIGKEGNHYSINIYIGGNRKIMHDVNVAKRKNKVKRERNKAIKSITQVKARIHCFSLTGRYVYRDIERTLGGLGINPEYRTNNTKYNKTVNSQF